MQGPANNALAIKERLERGQYVIDPHAIADAILGRSRCRGVTLAFGERPQPSSCSNPRSSRPASTNETPGGPSTIDPIQLTPPLDPWAA